MSVCFLVLVSAAQFGSTSDTMVVAQNDIAAPVDHTVARDPVTAGTKLDLPAEGEEVGYVISSVRWIATKWRNEEYGPAFAAILMLLLTVANVIVIRLGKEIRKHWMPTLSVITGIGFSLVLGLRAIPAGAGWLDWVLAIAQGASVGFAATGVWEFIGKKLFAKFLQKQKDVAAEKKTAKESADA